MRGVLRIRGRKRFRKTGDEDFRENGAGRSGCPAGGWEFGKWLGYTGDRRYIALHFVPDDGFPQRVVSDDGEITRDLADEARDFFIGVIQGRIMRRYKIDFGWVTRATYWLLVDTQSNALYTVVKDLALNWIEVQEESVA